MKTRGKRLTIKQINELRKRNLEIANLKKNGYSYKQIAERFDLSREYIKQICHKLGVYGPAWNYKQNRQEKLF